MGRSAVVESHQEGWLCGTGCFFVTPSKLLLPQYLVFLLNSPFVKAALTENSVGTTMNNLNHNILQSLLIPVPPINEQKKIMTNYQKSTAILDGWVLIMRRSMDWTLYRWWVAIWDSRKLGMVSFEIFDREHYQRFTRLGKILLDYRCSISSHGKSVKKFFWPAARAYPACFHPLKGRGNTNFITKWRFTVLYNRRCRNAWSDTRWIWESLHQPAHCDDTFSSRNAK